MKTMKFLLIREFEEHRGAFLWVPLAISGLLVVIMLIGAVIARTDAVHIQVQGDDQSGHFEQHHEMAPSDLVGQSLQRLAAQPLEQREHNMGRALAGSTVPLLAVLWFQILLYLLNSLYDERKDRSILFWKSMPVSDAMTVASKLVSAIVVMPLIYLGFVVVVQVILMLVSTVSALGQGVDIWATLWAPSHLVGGWFTLAGYMMANALWCLPLFGWLLLVSSWARNSPIAWAAGIPLAFILFERMLSSYEILSQWIGEHSWPIVGRHVIDNSNLVSQLLSLDMLVSLVIAAAMLYGAIYIRGRTDEM